MPARKKSPCTHAFGVFGLGQFETLLKNNFGDFIWTNIRNSGDGGYLSALDNICEFNFNLLWHISNSVDNQSNEALRPREPRSTELLVKTQP